MNQFRLEDFPNELIIELLKYFNTQDLFRIFYNLNSRFNYLIQSLIHLSYSTDKHDQLSYPYIRTLIINSTIGNKLQCSNNIRRLMLNYLTDDLISQLNKDLLPNLEYLSIDHKVHPNYMLDLRNKIFSDAFPCLKSCYISRMGSFQSAIPTFSLRFLKLNDIDSSAYLSILSACPNLYSLKFKLSIKSKIQSNVIHHPNLKRLIINMNSDYLPWDDRILIDYFLCIPNLEQFRISRSIGRDTTSMNYLQTYDWLYSIVTSHLFFLNQFHFDLYFNRSCRIIVNDFEQLCYDMNKYQFESLANELILQIFDYLDIRDIFNGFYDLNLRLNRLIQPFRNLCLTISENCDKRLDDITIYTDTLVIKDDVRIDLKSLINVRHVIVYCSYDELLTQINSLNFPCLEYMSISNNVLMKTNIYKALFCNVFNHLKYCNLSGSVSIHAKGTKTSIKFFKMGGIDFEIYQIILFACPNLFYLKFRMLKSDHKAMRPVRTHGNLKQLIMDIEISGWPCNDQLIDRFLELVPNLEQLNIYSSNFIAKIQESIIEYDWLVPIISNRLLYLRKFLFFFRLKWATISNQLKDRSILQRLQINFSNLHDHRYQSRFVIKTE